MSDLKISQLTDGGASQATDEYVVARSGANYRIDGASVAAAATSVGTLTSLTVSGDLTVDTSTLKVDSTNNRVGVGTASPGYTLDVQASTGIFRLVSTTGTNAAYLFTQNTGGDFYVGRDNSTGATFGTNSAYSSVLYSGGAYPMVFFTNATERLRLDSSGNLGLGVTPSAWASTGRAVQVGSSRSSSLMSLEVGGTYYTILGHNWYYDGTNDKYISTDVASRILQHEGIIRFQNAASGTAGNNISFTERARITSAGAFCVGTTTASVSDSITGFVAAQSGEIQAYRSSGFAAVFSRNTDDGTIVSLRQAGIEEGTISVSGNTVSYNAFAGSHWSQLEDGSKPEILRGTVMEALNELCEWPDESNERLPKAKVSDTAGSKKVYGVFMDWDNDWTATNDMYVTAVGAFICRVAVDVVVEQGDLLESNGDGTARVQADDVIRSSTIGKVTSTVKTHEYEDGTYCVPTVLYCG